MIRVSIKAYKCTGCGDCETRLPGLLAKVPLLLNMDTGLVNSNAVLSAAAECRLKAIKLEVV